MTKAVVVLAVPHQLQGPNFTGYIADPSYSLHIENLIKNGVDFVFEEASSKAPSISEILAGSVLGPGHYFNFDPTPEGRLKYGISKVTSGGGPIDPFDSLDTYEYAIVTEQRKREELWVHEMHIRTFEKALVVCGIAHGLSFAFRLLSAGFSINETNFYIPYHKFCSRVHA